MLSMNGWSHSSSCEIIGNTRPTYFSQFTASQTLPFSHSIFCSTHAPLPAPVPAAPSETWPLLCARALACAYAERLLAAKLLQSPA
jgi:hypothetical protein